MSTFIEDLSEKTALVDNDLGVIADSAASNQNKKVKLSSLWNWIKSKCGNSSGDVPISNGAVCANLNADLLDGYNSGSFRRVFGDYLLTVGSVGNGTSLNWYKLFTWTLSYQYNAICFTLDIFGRNHRDCKLLIKSERSATGFYYLKMRLLSSESSVDFDMFKLVGNDSTGEVSLYYRRMGSDWNHKYCIIDGKVTTSVSTFTYLNALHGTTEPVGDSNFYAGHDSYTVLWNSDNDGSGSNLDADKLDGLHSTQFNRTLISTISSGSLNDVLTQGEYCFAHNGTITDTPATGTGQYGKLRVIVSTGGTHDNANNWIWQYWDDISGRTYFRYKVNAGAWSLWYKIWTERNDGTGSGLDADKWDGLESADYLDQAVRTTDQPTFQQLTLSYPADSDYEAVRGDKTITLSAYSPNNAIQINGLTEYTKKMTQQLAFIIGLVQSDLQLGVNTDGCNINNGSSVLLGDANVSIDLPQRIDQGSDFRVRSLNIGDNDNNELYGAVANGKEAFARNIGEQAMCSGNAPLDTVFSGGVKANTNNVHMESVYQIPNDDVDTIEISPTITGALSPTVTLFDYISFNYGFSERLKHISYDLNIVLDFINGLGLYDSCTLNFNGMIIIDDVEAIKHIYKQGDSFSHNYAGNNLITESLFRNVELKLDFGTTPANLRIYPKLKIMNIDTTSFDWFADIHTSQTIIGDGVGCIISSWKWEFNSIQSSEKIVFMSKKK